MSSFTGTFLISYKDYCESNNIDKPSDEMIANWKDKAISTYEKDTPTDMVMDLFNIPKNYRNNIEHHEYQIESTGHHLNNDKKLLSVFMELSFTR